MIILYVHFSFQQLAYQLKMKKSSQLIMKKQIIVAALDSSIPDYAWH